MEIRDEELRHGERDPGDQRRRPHAEHPAKSGKGPHHPERHDDGEERELASGHLRERHLVETGDLGQRDDGRAQRAKGDGRGVGDERQAAGRERLEAQAHEDGGGDGDRRAEPRRALKKCAERKRHEDDLHARIGRERGEVLAQDFEETFLDRELVEKNQVENNQPMGSRP